MSQEEINAIVNVIIDANEIEKIQDVLPNKNLENFEVIMKKIIDKLESEKASMIALMAESNTSDFNIELMNEKINYCRNYLKPKDLEEKEEIDINKIIFAESSAGNFRIFKDLKDNKKKGRFSEFSILLKDFILNNGQLSETIKSRSLVLPNGNKKQIYKIKNPKISMQARFYACKLPDGYIYIFGALTKKDENQLNEFLKSRCKGKNSIVNDYVDVMNMILKAKKTEDYSELNARIEKSQEYLNEFLENGQIDKPEARETKDIEIVTDNKTQILESDIISKSSEDVNVQIEDMEEFKEIELEWISMFKLAKIVYFKIDESNLPKETITSVFEWVERQKNDAKKGKLSLIKIKALESIGVDFSEVKINNVEKEKKETDIDILKEENFDTEMRDWFKKYDEVKRYFRKNRTINTEIKNCTKWLNEQRCLYHLNLLSVYKIKRLELLEINWTYGIDNNDIEKMRKKLIKENVINSKHIYNRISEEELAKNQHLPDGITLEWYDNFKKVRLYYNQKGNINTSVPGYIRWLKDQRVDYHFGLLNEYQITKLEELHIDWNYDVKDSILERRRREYINKGILPKDFPHVTLDSSLGKKASEEKSQTETKAVSESQVKEKTDKVTNNEQEKESLNNINDNWNENYLALIGYMQQNNTKVIPLDAKFISFEKKLYNVGSWFRSQQVAYWNDELAENKINMLNKLEIDWQAGLDKDFIISSIRYLREQPKEVQVKNNININVLTEDNIPEELNTPSGKEWVRYFLAYKNYVETNGTVEVSSWCRHNGLDIGSWIQEQRWDKRNNKLSKLQIKLLNDVGMDWEIKNAKEQNEIDMKLFDLEENLSPKETEMPKEVQELPEVSEITVTPAPEPVMPKETDTQKIAEETGFISSKVSDSLEQRVLSASNQLDELKKITELKKEKIKVLREILAERQKLEEENRRLDEQISAIVKELGVKVEDLGKGNENDERQR